jgi:3-oxoacyl-[acyl-carrier protein] reductase
MAQRKFGRIVNITSSSVRAPIPGLDVSSGARAGLTAFLASSARAFAHDNVTINSIQPGSFDTGRLRPGHERQAAQRGVPLSTVRADAEARIPAGRFGDPAELGALCAFLASAHAGFITGQNILIDGGAFPGAF